MTTDWFLSPKSIPLNFKLLKINSFTVEVVIFMILHLGRDEAKRVWHLKASPNRDTSLGFILALNQYSDHALHVPNKETVIFPYPFGVKNCPHRRKNKTESLLYFCRNTNQMRYSSNGYILQIRFQYLRSLNLGRFVFLCLFISLSKVFPSEALGIRKFFYRFVP